MKTKHAPTVTGKHDSDANIVPLGVTKKRVRQPNASRQRFKVLKFINATGGTESWRVSGYRRDGTRVRENFNDLKHAECRQIELECEFRGRAPEDAALRATRLSETQIKIAELLFPKLDNDADALIALDFWLRNGKQRTAPETPRLDEAVDKFLAWLERTVELRPSTKQKLKTRLNVFRRSVRNVSLGDIDGDFIEAYLVARNVSAVSKDTERRALSRFFRFCIDRPQRWIKTNPCREVRVAQGEKPAPAVLSLEECKALLKVAQKHRGGRLVPYMAVCLFGGLRPGEAARITPEQVNFADAEIRLEGQQTKTGRARVVTICPTLKAWLRAYSGRPFAPSNWRKDFDAIKASAGFGEKKPWPDDALRHTAISHRFRQTGSYGLVAEQAGNSEAIIKAHYQGRVSSADTKRFYKLLPKGARKA